MACTQQNIKDENGQYKPEIVNNPASASSSSDQKLPKFDFDETAFDFGTIHSGDTVSHVFKFKNSGNAPLLITEATGSCGCTVPNYQKDPVNAGQMGSITVTYHSAGMAGQISKTVTILANTIPSTKVLTISAEVIK